MKQNILITLIFPFLLVACGFGEQFPQKSGLHQAPNDPSAEQDEWVDTDVDANDEEPNVVSPEDPENCYPTPEGEIFCEAPEGCYDDPNGDVFCEGEAHPCDAILEQVGQCESPDEMDAVFEEYDECMNGDIVDDCEWILENVDEQTPPEIVDDLFEQYDACLGHLIPENGCDAILEGIEHVFDPEELDLLLMAYDACIADEVDDELYLCEPILDQLESAQTPEEHDLIFEMYDDCLVSLGSTNTECDEIFALEPNEDPALLEELYNDCVGSGPSHCDDILVGLNYVSTPEEEEVLFNVYEACLVDENGPETGEPNEPQPGT